MAVANSVLLAGCSAPAVDHEWLPPTEQDDGGRMPEGREVIQRMVDLMKGNSELSLEARVTYESAQQSGQKGYVNGEPEIGAQVDVLPRGATTVEHDGVTYHQFDMVFFEEVEDADGETFYAVVDSPGDDAGTDLDS